MTTFVLGGQVFMAWMKLMYRGRHLEALHFALFLVAAVYSSTTLQMLLPSLEVDYVLIASYILFPMVVSIGGLVLLFCKKKTLYLFLMLDLYWPFTFYDTLFELGPGSQNFAFAAWVMGLVGLNFSHLSIRELKKYSLRPWAKRDNSV